MIRTPIRASEILSLVPGPAFVLVLRNEESLKKPENGSKYQRILYTGENKKKSDISIATQMTWISVLPMSKVGSSGREARHTVNEEYRGGDQADTRKGGEIFSMRGKNFYKDPKMAQNTSAFYIQGKTRKKSDISIATQMTWISVLPMSKVGSSGREARHTVNEEYRGGDQADTRKGGEIFSMHGKIFEKNRKWLKILGSFIYRKR